MKIWLKYLIAVVLGVALGLLLPLNGGDTEVFLFGIVGHIIHIGRYLVFPLVFFGLTIGTYELWVEKKFFQVYGRMTVYMMLSAAGASFLGAVFVTIFSPERVPIIIEETQVAPLASLGQQLSMIFPRNLFTLFIGNGDFLLPLVVFSIFLGLGLLYNRSFSGLVIDLFESLSRIVYNMNRVMIELLSLGMIFLAAYRTTQLRGMADLELFTQLLFLIIGSALFIAGVLIPGLLYLFGDRRRNPYTWLFGTLPTLFSGFLSGDMYFSISAAEGTVSQNMGIHRRASSAMIPLGAIFSRSGTAMITAVSFILILRSYSSLDISIIQFFWIIGASFIISFMLGTVPGTGMIVSLSLISNWYGQGLEEGFLILLPIAPILTSFAVLLDNLILLMNAQLVSDHESLGEPVRPRDFL